MFMVQKPDAQLVIFDLDHTLIRCDSFGGFTRDLLSRQWWRLAMACFASPLLVPLSVIAPGRLVAASAIAWIASAGLTASEFRALMERHVRARFDRKDDLLCRTAVRTLVAHHARGARVVIVTGAPADLARCVCESIGIPPTVEILGSTLCRIWGGWVTGVHCFGPRKVRMLAAMGIAHADYVYTDSATDLPLLKLGVHRVLVNARPRHQARVAAELEGTYTTVTWA